jgi:hypothetical protein
MLPILMWASAVALRRSSPAEKQPNLSGDYANGAAYCGARALWDQSIADENSALSLDPTDLNAYIGPNGLFSEEAF